MVTIHYPETQGWHDAHGRAARADPARSGRGGAALRAGNLRRAEGLSHRRWRHRPVPPATRTRAASSSSAERLAMPDAAGGTVPRGRRRAGAADRDWIPDGRGRLALPAALHVRHRGRSSACARPEYMFMRDRLARPATTSRRGAPAVSIWVSEDYTRAAPGGTGAAKCGGNYAASLVAAGRSDPRTAATRSCSSTRSSAAGSKNWAA